MDSTGLTSLLEKMNGGEPGAFGRVAERVYDQFRDMAHQALRKKGEQPGGDPNMGATVVAHDALLELSKQREAFVNRGQFFALGTMLMFRIIAQYRRSRLAEKRGGRRARMGLDAVPEPLMEDPGVDDETLMRALEALHEDHPEAAEVMTLHAHGRLALPRVAEMMGLPLRTVERRWQLARAFMAERTGQEDWK